MKRRDWTNLSDLVTIVSISLLQFAISSVGSLYSYTSFGIFSILSHSFGDEIFVGVE